MKTYKYFYEYRSVDGMRLRSCSWLCAENVTEAKAEAIHRIGELEFTDPRHRKLLWVELD